jgi:hypothetical protein
MRGKLMPVFVACVLIGSSLPLALAKKNKKDYAARLKALQKIYVDGSSTAVSYIRRNLSQETCLDNTPVESEADAVLEVWEVTPVPCGVGTPGICSSISAQLLDPKTNETLWSRTDDHIPKVDIIHQLNGPYQWVLWNLKSSCCKGRPAPPPPKDSKP